MSTGYMNLKKYIRKTENKRILNYIYVFPNFLEQNVFLSLNKFLIKLSKWYNIKSLITNMVDVYFSNNHLQLIRLKRNEWIYFL